MRLPLSNASLLLALVLSAGPALATEAARVVTGNVIANRSVILATRIMGRITRIHATEGDQVADGQVVVELDDTEIRAQLKIAEATKERTEADLANRQRTHKRLQKLSQTNAVSQDALDDAVYGLAVAVANLKVAEAEMEAIRTTLAETRIKAPFDAVVIRKLAEVGLVTQPGQALYEVQDQSQLKFRARVKERDLAHIKLNDTAAVTITALGAEPITARVVKLIPYGDDRHTFIIELELPARPGLYPGMFGKAVFK